MREELFCALIHGLKPVTAKNIVISTNFLMLKFCGKAQKAIRPKLCEIVQNYPQNFHTRKLGEIKAFYAMAGDFRKKTPS